MADVISENADAQRAEAYASLIAIHGTAGQAFEVLAAACVNRYFAQNGLEILNPALLTEYVRRVWAIVNEVGLPEPLAPDEPGTPKEMPPAVATDLVMRVLSPPEFGPVRAELDTITRQLVKACLHPEFRECRESYKAVVDGVCRRQMLARARERLSGAHCVDCPYWVALRTDQNCELLAKDWRAGDVRDFQASTGVFLPEDFRRLRLFLWWHVRLEPTRP